MLSMRRYQPFLAVLGPLAALFMVLNGAMLLTFGRDPHWLTPDESPLELSRLHDRLEEATSRLLSSLREDGGLNSARGLGLIAGSSTVHSNINLKGLRQTLGDELRWHTLYTGGGDIRFIARMIDLALAKGIRPRVTVLALHPYSLAGLRELGTWEYALRQGDWPELIAEGEWGIAFEKATMPWSWLLGRRDTISRWVSSGVDELRWHLMARAGDRVDTYFSERMPIDPGRRSPADPLPAAFAQGRSDRYWSMKKFAAWHWFDPSTYRADSPRAKVLADVVAQLHRVGSRVIVAIFPDAPELAKRIPPAATRQIGQVVAQVTPAVRVVDLRDAARPGDFADLSHLTQEGQTYFSPRFTAAVSSALAATDTAEGPAVKPEAKL